MTKFKFTLVAIIGLTLNTNHLLGQGCSDAGFCTINSFKPNSNDSTQLYHNQLKVGALYGNADHAIIVYGTYLEYNRQLNERFSLDAKLTTLAQSGNDIGVFRLSDIFVNAHYQANDAFKFTLGTKIPLSNANQMNNGRSLPMDYQSSLGTLDLIFGMGYEMHKTQWVIAIQQPLTHNNNAFIASNEPIDSQLRTLQSTKDFERSGDVLLRVSYPVNITSKLKITPSILPIYHLANDRYTDENNVKKEIIGSQGLTLNSNAYIDYELNAKSSIQFNVGIPLVVRDIRPDGLTRSLIANLEYRIKF